MDAASAQEVQKLLNSKKTFPEGVTRLNALVEACDASESAPEPSALEVLHATIKRCFTVLQSRFSNPAFWHSGLELFLNFQFLLSSLQAKTPPPPPAFKTDADGWVAAAMGEVGEEATKMREQAKSRHAAHHHVETAYTSLGTRNAPPPAHAALAGGAAPGGIPMHALAEMLGATGLGGLGGMGAFDDHGPPPASRDARFNLAVRQAAKGDQCAVCLEEFLEGAKAKAMPCGHLFHFDCILEWLERHNTCPSCRASLPSETVTFDDIERKIRQADPTRTTGLYA